MPAFFAVAKLLVCRVAVTVDKLPVADDDQAPMPSAPPIAMDAIQGYDAIAMDDGRCEC